MLKSSKKQLKLLSSILVVSLLILLVVSCATRGAQSFNLFSIEDERSLGLQVKNEIESRIERFTYVKELFFCQNLRYSTIPFET